MTTDDNFTPDPVQPDIQISRTQMEQYYMQLEAERKPMAEFWESLRTWFEEQGYFLYEHVDMGESKYEYSKPTKKYPDTPQISFKGVVEDPFPYAFMGPSDGFPRPPYSTTSSLLGGPVMYAQNVEGRHVAIKKLKNAEEYKVLRLLKDHPRLQDPDSFPSIVPILGLLQYDDQWFGVMPRWEEFNDPTFFPTFHLAIRYLISLLEGLAFLHELRIFHRDLCLKNTLVNHISNYSPSKVTSTDYHRHLKSIGALRYAIMDFDLAMVLDEETYGSNPRLPIDAVLGINMQAYPYENMHGYVDFDPFKYDVACLGSAFSDDFQQIIPDVPLLAPLLDRMITADIDKRFTAAEALAFARTILSTVSPHAPFTRTPSVADFYYLIDRWEGLPENFVKEWSSYRENYSSFTMRFQNWVYSKRHYYPSMWYMLYYCRYTARVLTWGPRLISRSCLELFKSIRKKYWMSA